MTIFKSQSMEHRAQFSAVKFAMAGKWFWASSHSIFIAMITCRFYTSRQLLWFCWQRWSFYICLDSKIDCTRSSLCMFKRNFCRDCLENFASHCLEFWKSQISERWKVNLEFPRTLRRLENQRFSFQTCSTICFHIPTSFWRRKKFAKIIQLEFCSFRESAAWRGLELLQFWFLRWLEVWQFVCVRRWISAIQKWILKSINTIIIFRHG